MPSGTFSGNGSYRLDVNAWRSGNAIWVEIGVTKTWGTGYYGGGAQGWSIWIDGTNYTGTWTYDFRGGTPKYIGITTQAKGGLAPGNRGWSASVNMGSGIGNATLSGSFDVPPNAPAAPTMQGVTRISDTTQNVFWHDNASGAAPYTGLQVQRQEHNGNWGNWVTVANGPNGATAGNRSFGDYGTVANRVYNYRIVASNGSGSAASGNSAMVFTSPGAPSSLTAVKQANGSIALTLAHTVLHTEYRTTLEYSTDNGATWSNLATLNPNVTTYSWATPPNGAQVKFRARVYVLAYGNVGDGLTSAWRESANVPLLSPPNAPSSLSPNGVAFSATAGPATLSWQHNTVDSSSQTAYELQYRIQGAATWTTTGKLTGTVQGHVFAPGTFVNGNKYEWQVRTWGAHPDVSAWSSTAVFTTSELPSATLYEPTTVLEASRLTIKWTYFDSDGTQQSAYEAQLLRNDVIVEQRSGGGTVLQSTFETRLEDSTQYTTRVRVRDGSGLWSTYSTVIFTTDFPQPPVPGVVLGWDEELGAVQITVDNPEPAPVVVLRRNLCLNPGFELNATNWVATNSTIARSTTQKRTGAASLQATIAAAVGSGATTNFNPTSGSPVTASMWVRPSGSGLTLQLSMTNMSGVTGGAATSCPPNVWTRLSVTGTATSTASTLRVLTTAVSAGSVPLHIDDVLIEDSATLGDFFDGNTPDTPTVNYIWVNAANVSTSAMQTVTQVAAVYNEIHRSLDGENWEVVYDNVMLNTTVSDPEAPLGVRVYYRVIAWSDLPSSSIPLVVYIDIPGTMGYWSAGPAFSVAVRLRYGLKNPPSIELEEGLAQKTLHYFAGRKYPVEFTGVAVERTGKVSFLIVNSLQEKDRVQQLALMAAPHLFRLPDGLFMYASIGPVKIKRVDRDSYTVDFSIQEVTK